MAADVGASGDKHLSLESLLDVLGLETDVAKNIGTKGILRLMVSTIHTTNNRYHRNEIRKFLTNLQNPKFESIQEAFYVILVDSISSRENFVSTPASSKIALELLKWVTIVGKGVKSPSPTFSKLLATLLDRIRTKRLEKSAKKKLNTFYQSIEKDAFVKLFKAMFNENKFVAIGMTIDYLQPMENLEKFLGVNPFPSKSDVLDQYLKECLMTKTAKSSWMLKKTCADILPIVTPDDFKATVFPVIQKAMLRSPEIAIEAVRFCLSSLQIDLSPFATDLGKIIGTSLYSKEDLSREQASLASVALCEHISVKSCLPVIEWYFDVFNGAEGKLTIASHKINILNTIKQLRTVKKEYYLMEENEHVSLVVRRGVKILETEGHEGTLLEAFDMLCNWISYPTSSDLPSELTNYFSKIFPNQKGAVRTAACRLLVRSSAGGHYSQEELLEILAKTFDKSYTQVGQVAGLSECIILAEEIMHLDSGYGTASQQAAFLSLWNSINEKFISSCNVWLLRDIAYWAKDILRQTESSGCTHAKIIEVIALLLITVRDLKDRKMVKELIDEALMYSNGGDVRRYILLTQTLRRLFETMSIDAKMKKELVLYIPFAQSGNLKVKDDRIDLAVELLWIAHLLDRDALDVWVQGVQKMEIDPGELITDWQENATKTFIDGFDNSQCMRSILGTLAFVGGKDLITKCVEKFIATTSDPAIIKVSRDEYFIFRTPEDQMYDTSVLDALDESMKNMKRESRVYSYKEQLEEIQLRKELEEKKRQSGKPVNYTAKQKEVIKTQMAKEKTTREAVARLYNQVAIGIGLLEGSCAGNPDIFGMFIKDFVSKLVDLMSSPVAASEAVSFFVKLGKSLFKPEIRGEAVAQCSLRLINPTCDLPPEWQEVSLLSASQSTLDYLMTVCQTDDGLSGAAFSFSFPLLRFVLKRFPKDTRIRTSVLQIISNVAKDASGSLLREDGFIPRIETVNLLYNIIGTSDGVSQQLAVGSILQLAKLISEQKNNTRSFEGNELLLHLDALNSPSKICRDAGIRSLNMICTWYRPRDDALKNALVAGMYREQFDTSSELASIAEDTWQKAKFTADDGLYKDLYDGVLHPCEEVRHSASKGLAAFIKIHPTMINDTIGNLISSYQEYNIPTPPLLDNLGRVLEEGIDKWEGRCGVGLAIREIASEMSPEIAKTCMEWLVTTTLSDRSPAVHNIMLEAAVEIVKIHGTDCLNEFISTIETFLDKAGSSGQYDNVRQACVVLMGCLARHLSPTDSRIKTIFTTLIDTLSTPSEKVQEAVANCLPALVPAMSAESESVLKRLLEKLTKADNFGERRGAAYGIAGMIKGLGILSLKQHDIMNILAEGMQDKKNYKRREGALMCLELLCEFLGRLFEPYIVHVLPYLLQCLGDSNVYVREATENTAKRVMSRLSAHGVKLVLPALIGALNEDSWRTKCGSVDLLGRMAYCAPKQLSGCLPMIVPRLIEVLGDSHVKVQESGAKALGLIGSVIQNPEIQSVVPVLLEALQDPGKRSSSCLQCLLQTEFVHFVDPPSLALILPVVQRAFQDRSTENRKMACQVIGNMYSLTDHSDLAPYMENVMPGIRASLVDPVPEVRAVASKALGSMAKGMGENCYDELLPWLMKTLISEANSVDRSGAAQGLAEVIGSLGEDKLHKFMPEIIRKADSDDLAPHVRDGYMMMFIYMPSVFEKEFVPYIGQIINPILKALADENEFVRETALRAGQRIVTGFADTAIALLLPELEKGIFDDNWRIRFSSIQLLGDLLYKISGVSGKMSTESAGDDDNFGTEQSQQTIVTALGLERRNRVLAGLYMGRSDVALMVRQAALHVWKVVVANTPKTLREILPTLFTLLLSCLPSASHDKRQVAARTLGDLVRKLGEKILPEIIPILERGLESDRADERRGVCIGLSEIMASISRDMVLAFVDNLVPTLRKSLCDNTPQVREAAAKTFASLHSTVGSRALDEIVPFLMKKLNDPIEGEYALDGLGQILLVKSKVVMPYLIPQLTAPPVNTKALAILAPVAGDSLSKHLGKILPALLGVLRDSVGTSKEQEELGYCEQIILTVTDDQGVRLLIDDLLKHTKAEKEGLKRAAVTLLSTFCVNTKADIEPYMSQLIKELFQLMTETDEVMLNLVADGLGAIVKGLDSAEKLAYVGDVRQAIRFVQSDLKGKKMLPGLCTSKGINPVLPIFREALLNGGADVKEQAAIGMGEIIGLSTEVALKPSVIHITGPLIRILSDRYGPDVKVAVLDTLTLLLMKVGLHLKAFLPQLQTTFLKASNDPNSNVRLKAASALEQLVPLQTKQQTRQPAIPQ